MRYIPAGIFSISIGFFASVEVIINNPLPVKNSTFSIFSPALRCNRFFTGFGNIEICLAAGVQLATLVL
jgi:hypothetical protein